MINTNIDAVFLLILTKNATIKSGNKTNEDVKRHLTYGIDKLKANMR